MWDFFYYLNAFWKEKVYYKHRLTGFWAKLTFLLSCVYEKHASRKNPNVRISHWLIMGKWCLHASSFIFDWIIIKVAGYQDRHKSSDEFDFGPLVSMAHLCFFFKMRFDLGTLDSGERSLGLLVWKKIYNWEIMGWTSGFTEIMQTWSADVFEKTYRAAKNLKSSFMKNEYNALQVKYSWAHFFQCNAFLFCVHWTRWRAWRGSMKIKIQTLVQIFH